MQFLAFNLRLEPIECVIPPGFRFPSEFHVLPVGSLARTVEYASHK